MLSAVPTQSAPDARRPREVAFRHMVEAALQLPGPEALDRIVQQYTGETRALSAHADGLAVECSEAAQEKRRYHAMLQQVETAAAHQVREVARAAAEVTTLREIFRTLRSMTEQANGEPLSPEGVAAVLSAEPAEPAHVPVTLAFLPSEQYRAGMFKSPDQSVTFIFTFNGWALINYGPSRYGVLEPMFMVNDRIYSCSTIESERRVKFDRYLRHVERRST